MSIRSRLTGSPALLLSVVLPATALLAGPLSSPALAGPVVCTTTLEAPAAGGGSAPGTPVEVTRCGTVQSVPELMDARFFSYTAPFARGVSLSHQITDLFGIAMGGRDGNRLMGLGYPDQTIIWDGSAVENTTRFLLDQQHNPMPLRTGDISSGFSGSLSGGGQPLGVDPGSFDGPQPFSMQGQGGETWSTPVRGLW